MNIIQVGPVALDSYELDEVQATDHLYSWFVYWYNVDGYEGGGGAVALRKSDGMLVVRGLAHCSCNGPIDDWVTVADSQVVSVEEFLRPKDSIFDLDCEEAIVEEVKLLLGLNGPCSSS
jgi:hypothetical protein